MLEDNVKEFDPSESEDFLKSINEALDFPEVQEPEAEVTKNETDTSQLIDIPNEEDAKEEEISDSELDEYDVALAMNLNDIFEEAAVTEDVENDDIEELPEIHVEEFFDMPEETLPEESEDEEEAFLSDNSAVEEDIIDEINAALVLQMDEINAAPAVEKKSKKWLLALIPIAGIAFVFTKLREDMPKWFMWLRISVFALFAVFCIGVVATGGKLVYNIAGAYIRWRMAGSEATPGPSVEDPNQDLPNIPISGTPNQPNTGTEDDPDSPVKLPANPPREEDHIYNILLLGEEKIGDMYSRGRTDLIMIATLDTEQRTVKLTSIMRDVLVAIPGHTDNRINAVFSIGGIDLLREVIELNFEIVPDAYMLVDFDSFEQVINNLGGVTIELSAEEANYLNTTNYISKPEFRNVVAGVNKMNGNQALGYCRIRHVPTLNNISFDFGRTSRQRIVLNAIFDKMKTKNLFQLAIIADSCLPLVETDLTASQISDYLEKAVECKITNFVQFRIPIDDTYDSITYNGITDLLQINYPQNLKALHEFIFGDYESH